MEPFYTVVFGVLAAVAAVLELTKSKDSAADTSSKEFTRFKNNYVLVYALMMGAPCPYLGDQNPLASGALSSRSAA